MSATRATSHTSDDDAANARKPADNAVRKSIADAKPGSERAKLDLPRDFGAPVDDTVESSYASHAALNQDPGRTQVRSNDEREGTRQAGAGAAQGGAGSGSGGDIDPDVVGFGRGLAASIPDRKERADSIRDDRNNTGRPAGSGAPAKGENQDRDNVGISNDLPRGSTVQVDADEEADGEPRNSGPDSIRTTSRDDPYHDGAVGEVSVGEADPDEQGGSSSEPETGKYD